MKKLPLGVQSFQEIIEGNYIYVDKTDLIHDLIQDKGYYVLTRPRRFGKTLLVETLEAIFQGKKKLFQDCQIAHTDYSWEVHPVVHLDFAKIGGTSSKMLEGELIQVLVKIAKGYGITLTPSSARRGIIDLVESLASINKVVVLIDEYDKPIVDNLHRIELAEANRDFLGGFFGALKSLHKDLRFVFITGVSKFAQVSLFSGLNNVTDITMEPPYENLLGYTEEEIRVFFRDYLMKIVQESEQTGTKVTVDQLIKSMREQYNGYRFSSKATTLYNPYSAMGFLKNGECENYWFRTGTPSFFIEHIKNNPLDLTKIRGATSTKDDLCDIGNLREIDQTALMWQTGYLTIQKYNSISKEYTLDFPNKEVREAFLTSLMKEIVKFNASETAQHATKCKEELSKIDLAAFFDRINTFLAKLPYHLFMKGIQEGAFHAFFLLLLEAMGIRADPEDPTNRGRADLSVEMPNVIYIFEFKINRKAKKAFSQIEEKGYMEKYLKIQKEVVAVGVGFSSETRNISSWQATIYDPEGIEKKKLQSKTKRK